MINFKTFIEQIDLNSLYKDNPEAILTLGSSSIVDIYSDYICYHIYNNYLTKVAKCPHIMTNSDYLTDDKIILYTEDCLYENDFMVRIYAKYSINNHLLEIIFIEGDPNNIFFYRD